MRRNDGAGKAQKKLTKRVQVYSWPKPSVSSTAIVSFCSSASNDL